VTVLRAAVRVTTGDDSVGMGWGYEYECDCKCECTAMGVDSGLSNAATEGGGMGGNSGDPGTVCVDNECGREIGNCRGSISGDGVGEGRGGRLITETEPFRRTEVVVAEAVGAADSVAAIAAVAVDGAAVAADMVVTPAAL
jgi:hypothetical protein